MIPGSHRHQNTSYLRGNEPGKGQRVHFEVPLRKIWVALSPVRPLASHRFDSHRWSLPRSFNPFPCPTNCPTNCPTKQTQKKNYFCGIYPHFCPYCTHRYMYCYGVVFISVFIYFYSTTVLYLILSYLILSSLTSDLCLSSRALRTVDRSSARIWSDMTMVSTTRWAMPGRVFCSRSSRMAPRGGGGEGG